VTCTPAGQLLAALSTIARTWALLAMMLEPMRLEMLSDSVGFPSRREKVTGSAKVRRTDATSDNVTVRRRVGADRQSEQIGRVLDDARHLDGEAAMAGVDQAGRNQPVVVCDRRIQLLLRDAIGFQLGRIDDDLEHLVALAADVDVQARSE